MGASVRQLSAAGSYWNTTSPAPWCTDEVNPPKVWILPPSTATPRWSRGCGSGARSRQRSVAGSYSSLRATALPATPPPSANSRSPTAAAATSPRTAGIGAFCDQARRRRLRLRRAGEREHGGDQRGGQARQRHGSEATTHPNLPATSCRRREPPARSGGCAFQLIGGRGLAGDVELGAPDRDIARRQAPAAPRSPFRHIPASRNSRRRCRRCRPSPPDSSARARRSRRRWPRARHRR